MKKTILSIFLILGTIMILGLVSAQENTATTIVKEQVKCVFVFANSDEIRTQGIQKCYTDDGQFECFGTGACVVDVSGEKGKKLTWKSFSCSDDYGYTTIDGESESIKFNCQSTKTPVIVKEQVECVFKNSATEQKCYTDDGKFGCSGTGKCVADVSGEKGTKQIWKSSCDGYAYTIFGASNYVEFTCQSTEPPVIVKEQVICVFANSNEIQECYTDDGKFGCSGTGKCVADVSGEKGTKQIWKSSCDGFCLYYNSCDGYATIIDGDNDYVEFKCAKSDEIIPIVNEQVKCVFKNSATKQKCYTAEDNSRFLCGGIYDCVMDVSGKKGEKLTWKSSCGGYAYTVIDGDSDHAEFSCISESSVTEEIISGKGFRYAYWQCYDDTEEKQGSESSCKSSETWQSYAKQFCDGHCYKDGSKCGVNSFSITEECYLDFEKLEVVFAPSVEEEEKKEEILICKDSCPLDGKCYHFGYRKAGEFCSDEGAFVKQLAGDTTCDNNFECSSNLCVDSQCVSQGLFKKIIEWFSKLFGIK